MRALGQKRGPGVLRRGERYENTRPYLLVYHGSSPPEALHTQEPGYKMHQMGRLLTRRGSGRSVFFTPSLLSHTPIGPGRSGLYHAEPDTA